MERKWNGKETKGNSGTIGTALDTFLHSQCRCLLLIKFLSPKAEEQILSKLSKIDGRLDKMEKETKQQFAKMEKETKLQLAKMGKETKQQFDKIEHRFEKMEKETKRQFDKMETNRLQDKKIFLQRLENIERKLDESLSPGQYATTVVQYGVYGFGLYFIIMLVVQNLPLIIDLKTKVEQVLTETNITPT